LGRVLAGLDQGWVSGSTVRQRFVEDVQDAGQDVIGTFDAQCEELRAAASSEPARVDASDPRTGWKADIGQVEARVGV